MSAHRWGCQVPNGPGWSASEMADIYGDGVFVVMQDGLDKLPEMRRLMPEALFIWRAYLPDWSSTDPRTWARQCAGIWQQIKQHTTLITWANEQNLRAESGGKIGAAPGIEATRADYERIRDWNLEWINEFDRNADGSARLVFPALAYGHSDDQDDGGGFVGLDILSPVIDLCDYGAVHLYVQAGASVMDRWGGIGRMTSQRPWFKGKQILVTETGCFEAGTPGYPQKILDIGYGLQAMTDIAGFSFFIHADPTHSHAQNDMSRDPQPYDAIRRAVKTPRPTQVIVQPPKPPEVKPVPITMPTPDKLITVKVGGLEVYDLRDVLDYARNPDGSLRNGEYDDRPLSAITAMVQHHAVTSEPHTVPAALSVIKAIYDWHTSGTSDDDPNKPHNWPSAGYHFAIDGLGNIYWLNGIQLITYHARQANAWGVGVVWMGTYGTNAPPAQMIEASRMLYRALQIELGRKLALLGHYEVPLNDTTCPGTGHWPRTKTLVAAPPVDPSKPVPAATLAAELEKFVLGPTYGAYGWLRDNDGKIRASTLGRRGQLTANALEALTLLLKDDAASLNAG